AREPPVGRPGPSRLSSHLDTSCDEAVRGPVSSLAHVRVLDLSRQLPGPFCSTLLADLGADVLAIAAPDDPFGVGMPLLARNKRSMRLNLKHAAGATSSAGSRRMPTSCSRASVPA